MTPMVMGQLWTQLGSLMATSMFVYAIFKQYFPYELRAYFEKYAHKLFGFFYPYITITFPEYTGERLRKSEAFIAIRNYLGSKSTIQAARRLKAEEIKDSKNLVLSMDDNQEVIDEYKGVKIWWNSTKFTPKSQSISYYPASDERRFYKLTFHRRHRDTIVESFISHLMEEGKAVEQRNRQRKLYMNNSNANEWWRRSNWSHVPFEHPSNFRTLAMDPKKKQEIVNDLVKFKNGKEYYEKVGKAWKRGFLLYGPPGTGKSSMIAAMANFMEYDVYDLELTSVKDNSELKKLLIDISSKSIIVIEDIDCSLDLTGQRTNKKTEEEEKEEKEKDKKDPVKKAEEKEKKASKVTLSGLLNFIDGIWSACGGERLIIFTTNHKEKLDEALIRRGRMDKHIEMSYCCFEAFKVLAMNYLDVQWHDSYDEIRRLLETTEMTPADVAENLMPKYEGEETNDCFKRLVEALETKKVEDEEAKKKAEIEKEEKEKKKVEEEEAKKKAEKEKENGDMKDNEIKCNGVEGNKEVKENGDMKDNEIKCNGVEAKKEVKENGDMNKN